MDGDDEPDESQSVAEAQRAAAEADTSDLEAAVPEDYDGTEKAAAATADVQDDGTSPEPASKADDDEEGASPTEDGDPADPETWTEAERKAWNQYKGQPREVLKALQTTKEHSNKQHRELEELRKKLQERDEPEQRALPAEKAEPTPEPAEIREARSTLESFADEYDAHEKSIGEIRTQHAQAHTDLLKTQGKIEDVEADLKALGPEASDYERGQLHDKINRLRTQEARLETQKATLATRFETKTLAQRQVKGQYDSLKERVLFAERRHRETEEASKHQAQTFDRRKSSELRTITSSLEKVRANLKIPKSAAEKFDRALLLELREESNPVEDLDAFFEEKGTFYRGAFDAYKADGDREYAIAKTKDARQPAPAAVATARPNDGPKSAREAERIAQRAARRIPI